MSDAAPARRGGDICACHHARRVQFFHVTEDIVLPKITARFAMEFDRKLLGAGLDIDLYPRAPSSSKDDLMLRRSLPVTPAAGRADRVRSSICLARNMAAVTTRNVHGMPSPKMPRMQLPARLLLRTVIRRAVNTHGWRGPSSRPFGGSSVQPFSISAPASGKADSSRCPPDGGR